MRIKTFEGFKSENEDELNNILDRMNGHSGYLSDDDRKQLNRASAGDNITSAPKEARTWLTTEYGFLTEMMEDTTSFGRPITKKLYHDDEANVYFFIEMNRPNVLYVSSEITDELKARFYLSEEVFNPLLLHWFQLNYLNLDLDLEAPQLREVLLFFKGF